MKDLTKLKILVFSKFFAEAMFLPFLALYYKSLGFNEAVIGLFIAIPPIVGISLTPVYSLLCKNVKVAKIIYSIICTIDLAVMFLYFVFTARNELLAVIIVYNIFNANNFGMLEGISTVCAANNKTDYARVRVFGSFAYAFGLLTSGFLTRIGSFKIAAYISGLLTLIAIIFCILLKVTPKEEKIEKRSIKGFLTNKHYFIFVLFYTIYIGTMNVGDDFFSTYLNVNYNFSFDSYGYLQSSFVIIEGLVVIFLFTFKKKFKFRHLYIFGITLAIIRFFITTMNAPLPLIVISGLTRGITWGIHTYLWAQFVINIVGKNNGTLAIMICSLILNSYQAVMKIVMGNFIENNGYFLFYLILTYILIFALIYFIIIYRNNNYVNNKKETLTFRVKEKK